MKVIGNYIDRTVRLYDSNILENGFKDNVNESIYLILDGLLSNLSTEIIDHIAQMNPLGIMVGGRARENLFDLVIESLSSKPKVDHVMTRMAEDDDLLTTLQEFFQSFWPDEDRFDSWTEYRILVLGYDASLIESYVRRMLD